VSETITPAPSAGRQIARAASVVMPAMLVSQLVGLLAKSLAGSAFGAQSELDAFFTANRFAEILFNLVAGGALASAFIPTFTAFLVREDRRSAWKLLSSLANLVTLVMLVVGTISFIFSDWLVVHVLARGFTDPAQQALAAHLLRIQLPSALIFGLSGLVMGSLNAHQRFLLPALAPAMYSLGWIGGATLLGPRFGIDGLAWGVLFGAMLHLGIQLPALIRLPEVRYLPGLGLKMPAVREVAKLMAPRLLGVAAVQINFWLNTLLASGHGAGAITGINLALPLMLMPEAAIAQSVAIAALPTFSAQVARGRKDEMQSALASSLRAVLLLAIPASLGLILLRTPLAALVYQRGVFTADQTTLVAWALLWYAAGLVGHSVVEIISRSFYALNDTKTPVAIGVAAMALNFGFSLAFAALFQRIGWMPHGGLALANSLATFLEAGALLWIMRRRLNGLQGGKILRGVFKSMLAAAGMTTVLLGWLTLTSGRGPAFVTLGGIALGLPVYAGLLVLLRTEEIHLLWRALRRRLKSSPPLS
jgi:putative peptidoglycan lipid II flippase